MFRQLGLVMVLAGCGRIGIDAVAVDAWPNLDDAGNSLYEQVIMADRPIAYWRFGEAGGSMVLDSIGTAHGTLLGGVTRVVGATNDGDLALSFDGSSGRVEIGDAFPLSGTSPYSIELWAKRDAADDKARWIMDRRTTAEPVNGWQVYTGKDFTLHSRTVEGTEQGYASSTEMLGGTWTHVVATYDGTRVAMYIDGTFTGGMLAAPINPGTGTLVFGDLVEGQFYKFDGVLDDIALYDVALSPAQVRAHFTASGR